MRKPLPIAAALVLLTTACRAEANFGLDVAADGSGTVTVEIGIDDELMELIEGVGGGTEDLFDLVPEGAEMQTRTEGDMTYYTAQEPFADVTELRSQIGTFEQSDVAFSRLELEVADGGARLDAVIEAPDAAQAGEALGGGFGDLAEDVFSSRLLVSLPGEVVESNADEVLGDGRLAWDLPLTGGTVEVMAVSDAGGSGFSWGITLAVAAAVAVVLGAAFLAQRRRNRSVAAIEATEDPGAPAGVFDGDAEGSGPIP